MITKNLVSTRSFGRVVSIHSRLHHPGKRLLVAESRKNTSVNNSVKKECWKCGVLSSETKIFCETKDCNAVQNLKNGDISAFKLLSVPEVFDVDAAHLDNNFKSLQKKLHPDKFAVQGNEAKEVSAIASSAVNQAYQILRDPILRADALMRTKFDTIVLDEADSTMNPSLMIEIFNFRELLEEVEDEAHVKTLLKDAESKQQIAERNFTKAYNDRNIAEAKDQLIRMKYYSKIVEEVLTKMDSYH